MLFIEDLCFSFGNNQVLQNINLTIEPGEFIGIIGPNGAGKSTLLKMVDGIYIPDSGRINLDGRLIIRIARKELARLIAFLQQETEFAFSYSVEEVIRMGRFPYSKGLGYFGLEDEKILQEVMHLLHVENFKNRSFSELSGGEKQRVLIASALAQQPKIILLDEPTSALDLHHQIEIYQILKTEQQKRQLTIIVVTHDINLAAQFCDRMVLMQNGKILDDGPPEKVLKFEILQNTFGVKVYIDINPMTNSLYILPYG